MDREKAIDRIIKELSDRKEKLQMALDKNPQFKTPKHSLTTIITTYSSIIKYIEMNYGSQGNLTLSEKQEDNLLVGWLSKTKDGNICIHHCRCRPEKIGDEWVGDQFDTIIERFRVPGIQVPDQPVRVEISFKQRD